MTTTRSSSSSPLTTTMRCYTNRSKHNPSTLTIDTRSKRSNVRLFGSKRIPPPTNDNNDHPPPTPTPSPTPGEIYIYNEQTTLPQINIPQLKRTITILREILTYPTYDITVILTDDEEMRQTNLETRGVDSPTDILSFPFHEVAMVDTTDEEGDGEEYGDEDGVARERLTPTPGVLEEPDFDMEDYYTLGDMMIDVPYVIRRCEEDRTYYESSTASTTGNVDNKNEEEGNSMDGGNGAGEDDDGLGDRGVSWVMAKIYDPEERIRLLLIHGMLHLVGYDHIEDDEYELMVTREEEVVVLLREALEREEEGEEVASR